MKTNTIKWFLIASTFLGAYISKAADLVVQDNGPVGTYASISAAVTAASNGDRILINNQLSGLPWAENITINKSLTLLSAVDNQRFLVNGTYTVVPAPGREVNIIGMENTNGSIVASGAGSGSRTKVSVMGCLFQTGGLTFNQPYFELIAASNIFNGSSVNVSMTYGKIIGNDMGIGVSLNITDDGISANDTIFIVGNLQVGYLNLSTSSHYFFVANNYITSPNTANFISLYLGYMKSGAAFNNIKNNTIYSSSSNSSSRLISFSSSVTSSNLRIFNNIMFHFGGPGATIYTASSLPTISYNIIPLPHTLADPSNIITTPNITYSTGTSTAGVDLGTPGITEYDLDLTRNDIGCYGGSYSIDNFHPINGPSSKVYFLQMPKEILIGSPNTVKGYSFDK